MARPDSTVSPPPANPAAQVGTMVVLYATAYPALAYALPAFGIAWSAFLRSAISVAAIAAILGAMRRPIFTAPLADQLRGILLGAVCLGPYVLLAVYALESIPPGEVTVFAATIPLWVLVIVTALGDRPPWVEGIGAVVGFGGVVLVALGGHRGAAAGPIVGTAAVLAAAALYALDTVAGRRWFSADRLVSLEFHQMLGASLALIPVIVLAGPAFGAWTNPTAAGAIVWVGVVATGVPLTLWFVLLGRGQAAAVSVYLLLTPIVALAISYVLFREPVTLLQGVGVAIILFGSWMAHRGQLKVHPHSHRGPIPH